MNLSQPLDVVTPTLDSAVLHTLAATTGWVTGGELHRRCGTGSRDGVRRVALRLATQGIVLSQEHPHATLFLLNRDHVSADALIALTRVRTSIMERLANAFGGWALAPVHASTFGSFARGEAGTNSDIDVLLVQPSAGEDDVGRWTNQTDRLALDVERWTGNAAHIVSIEHELLAAMAADDDPLLRSWRADHVHLYGTHLMPLLRRVT